MKECQLAGANITVARQFGHRQIDGRVFSTKHIGGHPLESGARLINSTQIDAVQHIENIEKAIIIQIENLQNSIIALVRICCVAVDCGFIILCGRIVGCPWLMPTIGRRHFNPKSAHIVMLTTQCARRTVHTRELNESIAIVQFQMQCKIVDCTEQLEMFAEQFFCDLKRKSKFNLKASMIKQTKTNKNKKTRNSTT